MVGVCSIYMTFHCYYFIHRYFIIGQIIATLDSIILVHHGAKLQVFTYFSSLGSAIVYAKTLRIEASASLQSWRIKCCKYFRTNSSSLYTVESSKSQKIISKRILLKNQPILKYINLKFKIWLQVNPVEIVFLLVLGYIKH